MARVTVSRRKLRHLCEEWMKTNDVQSCIMAQRLGVCYSTFHNVIRHGLDDEYKLNHRTYMAYKNLLRFDDRDVLANDSISNF